MSKFTNILYRTNEYIYYMNILFDCNYDCVLKLDSKPFNLIAGTQKLIDANFTEAFCEVFFKAGNQLPYFYTLKNTNGNLICDNKKVNVIKITNNNFYVFLQNNYIKHNQSLAFLSTQNFDYEVLQQDLTCLKVSDTTIWKSDDCFINAKMYQKCGLVFCELFGNSTNKLLVVDNHNNILIDESFDKIEHAENGFLIAKYLHDMHKHGIVFKYEITDTDLILKDKYSVYLNQKPKDLLSPKCQTLAFFECIKAENIKLAKYYLTTSLASKISMQHASTYFGNFNKIINTNYFLENTITLTYSNNTCKTFKIEYENNLIDNITQIKM